LPFDDGVHTIEAGGVTLVLEVTDGAARVVSSDCPDGLCMAMPAISRGGGTIVCVPAEVVISAGASEGGLDGVAG
ncbi:MAG: NusG domain II-containing protein, partial [Clostridia bacterium]|nr:NusG domain II-containing protein [Clostridia bacterium]